jgi:hypothetical protein
MESLNSLGYPWSKRFRAHRDPTTKSSRGTASQLPVVVSRQSLSNGGGDRNDRIGCALCCLCLSVLVCVCLCVVCVCLCWSCVGLCCLHSSVKFVCYGFALVGVILRLFVRGPIAHVAALWSDLTSSCSVVRSHI